MMLEEINITSPEVGRSNTFVYCIYITAPKAIVYIGETRSNNGALGRLSGHMNKVNGTFIKKCLEKKHVDIDKCNSQITMLAFNLIKYPEYCGEINSNKRRALEYFVNDFMEEYSVSDDTLIPFDVVSWTQIASRFCDNEKIQNQAKEIAKVFYEKLPFS